LDSAGSVLELLPILIILLLNLAEEFRLKCRL